MNKKAVAAVIAAGVMWGVMGFFVDALKTLGFDSFKVSMLRMFLAALLYGGFMLIRAPEKMKISLKDVWMFVGTGILSVALTGICYFYTIIHAGAAVAVVLDYTAPVFVMLFGAVLFKEKITPVKIAALVLTVGGCVFVSGLLNETPSVTPFVFLVGIGAGFSYAMYSIFGRYALKKYSSETVTAYSFVFAFFGSLVLGKPAETVSLLVQNPIAIPYALGIAVIGTVLPYLCYTWGLQRMEAGQAAILVSVEPIVAAVLGMTVLHESREITKIFGILLILAAVVLMNLKEKKVRN